jgi:hypothetical protein
LLFGLAFALSGCGSETTTGPTAPPVSFTGVYSGTYVVASCSGTADLTGFCTAGFPPGTRLPISLSLEHAGNSVVGTITMGAANGTFKGTASGASLSGTAAMNNLNADGVIGLLNVPAWNSTLNGNAMSGAFTQTIQIVGYAGGATVMSNISTLNR